jgi:hypothetical protein
MRLRRLTPDSGVRAADTLGLSLLEPPYQTPRPAARRIPALGASVLCDIRPGPTAIRSLSQFLRRSPWCPPCALVPSRRVTAELLEALDRLPPGCPKVVCESELHPVEPERIVEAVARRPAPTAEEMASYVVRRLGREELTETFFACFGGASGPTRASRSTLSRRLQALPPLTARDWEAIGQLARVFASDERNAERLARSRGLDPRTLRARASRYFNLSWEEARGFVGWEWVLEAALRRWRYLAPPFVAAAG